MDLAKENQPKPNTNLLINIYNSTYPYHYAVQNVFFLLSLSLDITRSPFFNHPRTPTEVGCLDSGSERLTGANQGLSSD